MQVFRKPYKTQFELTDLSHRSLAKLSNEHPIKGAGVYIFRSNMATGRPSYIPRCLGTDPFGILYIGMSKRLNVRVSNFITDLRPYGPDEYGIWYEPSKVKHNAALTYTNSEKLQNRYPYNYLSMTCIPIDGVTHFDARLLEMELLDEYISIFGEVPPLNSTK